MNTNIAKIESVSLEEIEKDYKLSGFAELESADLKQKFEELKIEIKKINKNENQSKEPQKWQILQKEIADIFYDLAYKIRIIDPILLRHGPIIMPGLIYMLHNILSDSFIDKENLATIAYLSIAAKYGSANASYDLCVIFSNADGRTARSRDFEMADKYFKMFCQIGEEQDKIELEKKLNFAKKSYGLCDKIHDNIAKFLGYKKQSKL